jgi:hypothetical protein
MIAPANNMSPLVLRISTMSTVQKHKSSVDQSGFSPARSESSRRTPFIRGDIARTAQHPCITRVHQIVEKLFYSLELPIGPLPRFPNERGTAFLVP